MIAIKCATNGNEVKVSPEIRGSMQRILLFLIKIENQIKCARMVMDLINDLIEVFDHIHLCLG